MKKIWRKNMTLTEKLKFLAERVEDGAEFSVGLMRYKFHGESLYFLQTIGKSLACLLINY